MTSEKDMERKKIVVNQWKNFVVPYEDIYSKMNVQNYVTWASRSLKRSMGFSKEII